MGYYVVINISSAGGLSPGNAERLSKFIHAACGLSLKAISHKMLKISFTKWHSQIISVVQPHFHRVNELTLEVLWDLTGSQWSFWIIILYHNKVDRGVYWFHSVCPSIRPSRIPCPLCSAYSSSWIHFIFIHLIKQLQKICRVSSFLQNFKIGIFLRFFKICVFDFLLFWLGIWCESPVGVIMGRQGVSKNAGIVVVARIKTVVISYGIGQNKILGFTPMRYGRKFRCMLCLNSWYWVADWTVTLKLLYSECYRTILMRNQC